MDKQDKQDKRLSRRAQQTRERIRAAAHGLFLRQGYLATSVDAILEEAGIGSKETFYRHYTSKEALFVDILSHLTMEQPGLSERLSMLPVPHDLESLRHALTQVAREILAMISRTEYLALVRIVIAESPRFPQLGALFFETVTLRGFAIIIALLRQAQEQHVIAGADFDTTTRALVGGLLTYAIPSLVSTGELAQSPPFERADALVDLLVRALAAPMPL